MKLISGGQFEKLRYRFEKLAYDPDYQAPFNTVLVVALSAPPTFTDGVFYEDNSENQRRIDRAVQIGYQVAAAHHKANGHILVTGDETALTTLLPNLVVNAEAQQLYALKEYAKGKYLQRQVIGINCGNRGEASTRTQMDAMTRYEKSQGIIYTPEHHVVFVTSLSHVPRAQYTADMVLRGTCNFTYEIVAASKQVYEKSLAEEFGKIISYAQLGYLELPE